MDKQENELIFKVHRLKDQNGNWMPALEDIAEHEITPIWAAALCYVVFDRYVSATEESKQIQFLEETLYWLDLMLKDNKGSEFIINVDKDKFL